MDLQSKTAIVTGASRGSGEAYARALAKKGCRVYGLARGKELLTKLQSALGDNFVPTTLDIADYEAVSGWIKSTFSEKNQPDILINNAGAGHFEDIDALPWEKWHQMINTNLNAVFYLTSLLVPFMKKNKNTCHIINIGSILGKTSGSKKAAYSATKYGMQGFSEALFKELRGFKIKVTCLNPGSINTHFFESSGIHPNENMLQPEDLANILVNLLETPDNVLIDEITVRPLLPK